MRARPPCPYALAAWIPVWSGDPAGQRRRVQRCSVAALAGVAPVRDRGSGRRGGRPDRAAAARAGSPAAGRRTAAAVARRPPLASAARAHVERGQQLRVVARPSGSHGEIRAGHSLSASHMFPIPATTCWSRSTSPSRRPGSARRARDEHGEARAVREQVGAEAIEPAARRASAPARSTASPPTRRPAGRATAARSGTAAVARPASGRSCAGGCARRRRPRNAGAGSCRPPRPIRARDRRPPPRPRSRRPRGCGDSPRPAVPREAGAERPRGGCESPSGIGIRAAVGWPRA